MPQTRFIVDALGVVTIGAVAVLFVLGLFCILYSFYFRSRIRSHGFIQLGYFSGPWAIRIAFILLAIWWGFGEIIRLNLLRYNRRLLNAVDLNWQENICKCYIVSNLGFAEPCFFLTLAFLLRASLQTRGTLGHRWNGKTAGYVLLYCLPVFVCQLMVILIGPKFSKEDNYEHALPSYFTRTASKMENDDIALCTYPLLSTLLLGLFATILTTYLFWLGRQILHLVINKALQKRVYTLIILVSGFFPLRVLLLGLSVLSEPEDYLFETLAFLAFLSLLCCLGVGICTLVYFPVADSLALEKLPRDLEARRRFSDEHNDIISLVANQSLHGESTVSSPERDSSSSTKCGSISFRAMDKDETTSAFLELSVFSPSSHSNPPGSSRLLGWPMLPPA